MLVNHLASQMMICVLTSRVLKLLFRKRTGLNYNFKKWTGEWLKNESINDLVGQAVPSVSPGQAATHFNKIECFCFNRQPLAAGSETLMPLTFYIDKDLPDDIDTVTLTYTMFDVTDATAVEASQSSQTGE